MVNQQANPEPSEGDLVLVTWGLDGDVSAEVVQVYGPPARRHVLVRLTPDLSGDVVAEPTTLSVPLDAIKQPEAA